MKNGKWSWQLSVVTLMLMSGALSAQVVTQVSGNRSQHRSQLGDVLSSSGEIESGSIRSSSVADFSGPTKIPQDGSSAPEINEAAMKAEAARQAKIRSQLTGDWLGRRSLLEDRGISVRSSLTQFYQGVASGGTQQRFSYGGKLDLFFDLNTQKMGLWEGGELLIHASDWQFGQNAIQDAGFGSPVNMNLLFPEPQANFTVSTFLFTQGLNERGLAMLFGRYSLLDLWASFYPDYGFGLDGFMNASAIVPFNIALAGLPPISNMGGIVKAGPKGLEAGLLAFENADNSNRFGMDFQNGVTLLAFGRKYTEFGGLFGSHTVGTTYATGKFTSLNTNDWIVSPGGLPSPTQRRGQWAAVYIGEQRIFQDPTDERRYTTLKGSICWGDANANPYNLSTAITLEKFGTNLRPGDRMGIAYFYNSLGDQFQGLLNFLEPHGSSVQGGEVYYNAQVTPWFQLTADLQAISPINTSRDTALVLGLRGKINF